MAINSAFDAYSKSENEYVPGIESAHGRIKILFDTMISNLDKLKETHPKTDFISLGKCVNILTVLAGSLNVKDGGELAQNLLELYDYCKRVLNEYVEGKDVRKLDEVYLIFTNLSEGWDAIES